MESLTTFLERTFILVVERGEVFLPVVFLAFLALAIWTARRGGGWRPRGFWRWTGVVLCLLVAALATAAFGFQYRVNRVIAERAGAIRLQLLADGAQRTVTDYRGRVVVLNFWATWCPPCREEMPDLNRFADAYRDRGVTVLTVSDQPREEVEKYTAEHPLTTENALFTDTTKADGTIADLAYQGRPTTLVLDREGRVRKLLLGRQHFEELEGAVAPYL